MSTQYRFSSTGMKAKREKIQFSTVITKQDIIEQLIFQTDQEELLSFIKLLDQEAEDWNLTKESFKYYGVEMMTYIDNLVISNEEIDEDLINMIERLYNNVHPQD
jgi:hypothetical protein